MKVLPVESYISSSRRTVFLIQQEKVLSVLHFYRSRGNSNSEVLATHCKIFLATFNATQVVIFVYEMHILMAHK